MTIKGIGQYFAMNIIKKRDAFGGFISKKQLLEVWKFDEEKLALISDFVSVDPNLIKQIISLPIFCLFHLHITTKLFLKLKKKKVGGIT